MTDNENKPAATLEPCPFCGSPARAVENMDDIEEWVQCTKRKPSRCPMSKVLIPIAEWNRRATKASAVPEQSHAQLSIDTPEFRELVGKVYKRTSYSFLTANAETQALIVHIDAKLTQANSRAEDWEHAALLASRENQALRAKLAETIEDVKYVNDKFSRDLEQGYKTKDKEFATSILGRRLKLLEKPE